MFLGLCTAFVIFINVALGLFANVTENFPYGNTKFSLSSLYTGLYLALVFALVVVSLVTGHQHRHKTFKNSISFGMSRRQIYLGSMLIEVVMAMINYLVISSAYIITAYIMLENSGSVFLTETIKGLMVSVPLLLFSLLLANLLYFIVDTELHVYLIWIVIMMVIPGVLSLAGRGIPVLAKIALWMPWNILQEGFVDESTGYYLMSWTHPEVMVKCLIVGLGGSLLCYMIGLSMYQKKDI